jgi:putative ABC transport system substrate-binding protein
VATLWTTSRALAQPYIEEVEGGLKELGWVAGKNLTIEHFCTEAKAERLPVLAAEVIAWKPDVAAGMISTGAVALKRLTNTVPIVVGISEDPVDLGFAESLARPGGNVTGSAGMSHVLVSKNLQFLRELLPRARQIGIVWNTEFPGKRMTRDAAEQAAAGLGFTIIEGGVKAAGDFAGALGSLARARIDALYVIQDNLTFLHRREIVEAAARHRWPAMFGFGENCDDGGLLCHSVNLSALFRRSAVFIDRILRGTDPAVIPFEQPTRFDLVINLKTARSLGITVPQPLLLRATRVIE